MREFFYGTWLVVSALRSENHIDLRTIVITPKCWNTFRPSGRTARRFVTETRARTKPPKVSNLGNYIRTGCTLRGSITQKLFRSTAERNLCAFGRESNEPTLTVVYRRSRAFFKFYFDRISEMPPKNRRPHQACHSRGQKRGGKVWGSELPWNLLKWRTIV